MENKSREIKRPKTIEVRGGAVNNLKKINVDIPLDRFVAISGLSGSGKTSLAMGILYAEGSRRYLEALSTYTRNRLAKSALAKVRTVRHIPSALALKQRPSIPNERSTVGTMSEIFNVVRLIFSRLGSLVCPNGHRVPPTIEIAKAMDRPMNDPLMGTIKCPTCGERFHVFAAEDFSFNSVGACPECHGTGKVRTLDESKLIADPNLSLADGAVASWRLPGRNFMHVIAEKIGVRTNIPYKELSKKEKEIVLHGKKAHYPIDLKSANGRVFHMNNALYENAYDAVLDSLATSKSERSIARINRFFHFSTCPKCHGSRLDPKLLTQLAGASNIAEVQNMTLGALPAWQKAVIATLPANMHAMAAALFKDLHEDLDPLLNLGLDYLVLLRSGNTLSTGELQRIQLSRTLRSETTGVLYVLDEPSIGLHPDNVRGLLQVFNELLAQGNSLVVVDHEIDIIGSADEIIEIGPGSGAAGGRVIAQGTPAALEKNKNSLIAPFLTGEAQVLVHTAAQQEKTPPIRFSISDYYNLHDIEATIPTHAITAVTGFSGAGKTSLILNSLVPAIRQRARGEALPPQVSSLESPISQVISVDASPVGKNERSTVATYTNIMDNLRKLFAAQPAAKERGYDLSYFSYNNKEGACPTCGGTGSITLDIQFLPDMEEICPTCHGTRFKPAIQQIKWHGYSIVDILDLSIREAIPVMKSVPQIARQLNLLNDLGLGYLHVGESTPKLSGGEAQRLKLVKHLYKKDLDQLFVFDEPSVGLHPLDVQVLIKVLEQLLDRGATIILITHDLDLMLNADHLLDLGPRGGEEGGKIMAQGAPLQLLKQPNSLTLKYLAAYYAKFSKKK